MSRKVQTVSLLCILVFANSAALAPTPIDWHNGLHFLLNNSELSTLATFSQTFSEGSESSLMFNTFYPQDGVLLFVSKEDVKTQNIRDNKKVSVLLNSFEGRAATNALLGAQIGALAMTVYGNASIVQPDSDKEKQYRAAQVAAHPEFAGAFQGQNTTVFSVTLNAILIVDVHGRTVRVRDPLSPAAVVSFD